MVDRADLLVTNGYKVLTLAGPDRPRCGAEMSELGEMLYATVAIADGKVLEIGPTDDLMAKYRGAEVHDAFGGLMVPGLVDSHTHATFTRTRSGELAQRVAGATYQDILAAGGGIHSTVAGMLAGTEHDLRWVGTQRFKGMIAHGTTTAEVKSGYGLNLETERKILRIATDAARPLPIEIVRTFLGAHVVPEGADRTAYVDMLVNDALPELTDLAEFCDVFCDDGAFTLAETRRIFEAATKHGYKLTVHAGQFADLGAAGLAAEFGAISADHLEFVSDEQLERMRQAGTIATLLPGTPFYLLTDDYADARRIIDAGVPVALATDFNPGSCPCLSLQMMMSLACMKMRMTPAEAVTAVTINAACAIDRADRIGSLAPGKQADMVIMDVAHEGELVCQFGINNVKTVIKAGQVVWPCSE